MTQDEKIASELIAKVRETLINYYTDNGGITRREQPILDWLVKEELAILKGKRSVK